MKFGSLILLFFTMFSAHAQWRENMGNSNSNTDNGISNTLDILNSSRRTTTPTEDALLGADPAVRQACNASYIARLSISTMYGNCDAADAVEKGGGVPADSMCQSMPKGGTKTLDQVWSSGGQCPRAPKKPQYSQAGARMTTNGGVCDPLPNGQTDCSGFWSGVAARLGWRLEPGKDLKGPTTTAQMVQKIPGACFEEPKDGLLPGDTIVWNVGGVGHVVLIDRISVGGSGSGCEFSIIHSTGGPGPQIHVKGGASGGGRMSDNAGATANRLGRQCAAQVGQGKPVKIGRFNPNKPGCQGPKEKFKNEECLSNRCNNLGTHTDV